MESDNKTTIINLFNKNVKGKKIEITNKKNYGAEGHWLETQMGIQHNSDNSPDILGFEMKKISKKITFGDFSASEYLFSKRKSLLNGVNEWKEDTCQMTRDEFIKYFGNQNPHKHNRYSWSGSCVPIYGEYNECGQKIFVDSDKNIRILYKYSQDKRIHKTEYDFLKSKTIVIAVWTHHKMSNHINNKFNCNGFFICKKIGDTYQKICFGNKFNFDYFIESFKEKKIIFDSGMYLGNSRNYSQFRSSESQFWDKLITEEY